MPPMQDLNIRLLVFLLAFPMLAPAQPFSPKMGVGLDGIGGKALEFPNVTLTARDWQSVATGGNAATDGTGWPIEDFRAIFFDHRPFNAWNNAPDDPDKYVLDLSGTYTLSFKGQATLTSWSDAPIAFQNKVYDSATNTTTLDIVFPPGGGPNASTVGNYGFLMVNFLQTNFGAGEKGVKDIRLMRPGYPHHSPQLFRTEYLNAISPFSTLRVMDFLATNNSNLTYPGVQSWSDRQKPDAPRYTRGAPWETIIALANYTGKDLWINIPVDADSMYVVELARLMKATLRPEIRIYIEYSNEVWNGSFAQFQYNYDAVLLSVEDADIRASTPWDDRRRARRVAKQVIKCGKIFENELGVSVASRTRIRPVFAWQIGGWLPWYEDVLQWVNSTYGPLRDVLYGIASAPYFGEGNAGPNATPQEIVAAMSATSDANVSRIQTLAQLADQWQIKHLQYEGGPDNGGGSTQNIANRIAANRIPEMKTAVIHNYRDNWFSSDANGTAPLGTNDLANYFVMSGGVSRYGCWGAIEDLDFLPDLAKAPKYDALCYLTGMCGNEPEIELLNPADNSMVPVNNPFEIAAEASDLDGTLRKVEFFVGTALVGIDSISPYSISWTPVEKGFIAVVAKAIDNDGKYTFTDAHTVEVVDNVSGTLENNKGARLRVYPVPAIDAVEVSLEGMDIQNGELEVRDMVGRLLFKKRVSSSTITVDLGELKEGIFVLTLNTARQSISQKFIKAN